MTTESIFGMEVRSIYIFKTPIHIVKTTKTRKAAEFLQSAKQAKRRVAPIQLMHNEHLSFKGDIEGAAKIGVLMCFVGN